MAVADRKALFFLIQLAIALYVALTLIAYRFALAHTFLGDLARLTDSFKVPPPAVDFQAGLRAMWETWGSAQGVYKLTDTLFWPVLFVLMPTVLMGASFPLAAYLANGDDSPRETRGTGALYVWNVIGNVLGAAVTAFFLIPRIGSEATFLLFCLAGTAFGVGVTRLFRRRVPLGIRAVGSSSSW